MAMLAHNTLDISNLDEETEKDINNVHSLRPETPVALNNGGFGRVDLPFR